MMLYPLPPPPSFAFHVVEVMSSPRYHLKRKSCHPNSLYVQVCYTQIDAFLELGYLAAPMAFSSDTEEVVLTVNGIRKVCTSEAFHLELLTDANTIHHSLVSGTVLQTGPPCTSCSPSTSRPRRTGRYRYPFPSPRCVCGC
jgi:hypothetical protein